jgi:hypothetical protein
MGIDGRQRIVEGEHSQKTIIGKLGMDVNIFVVFIVVRVGG